MLNTAETSENMALLKWIDEQQESLLSETIRLADINSGSQNLSGLTRVHDILMELFSPLADEAESIPLESSFKTADNGEQVEIHYGNALRFSKRPDAPFQVLLCGHMDSVFSAEHPFQSCRQIDVNRINGPGTADMKAGLMVILHVLKAWEQHPMAELVGWEVLINPDEEIGSCGSGALLAERARRAHIGMVYEPALADGTLAGERKGSGYFALRINGRSAHAGREFEAGRNAIAALAQAMSFLHSLNQQREGITLNLGRIHGGTALNVVADAAICHFNIRCRTVEDQQWVQGQLDALIDALHQRSELSGVCVEDGLEAKLSGSFERPPKQLSPLNQQLFSWLEDCGKQLNIAIRHRPTGGCCDGNNLAAAGLPNIDSLGVRGGNIHTKEEFLCIDSLTERTKLSLLLLERFAHKGTAYVNELKLWRQRMDEKAC